MRRYVSEVMHFDERGQAGAPYARDRRQVLHRLRKMCGLLSGKFQQSGQQALRPATDTVPLAVFSLGRLGKGSHTSIPPAEL